MKNTLKRTVAVFLLSFVAFNTLNNVTLSYNATSNENIMPLNDEFEKVDVL